MANAASRQMPSEQVRIHGLENPSSFAPRLINQRKMRPGMGTMRRNV